MRRRVTEDIRSFSSCAWCVDQNHVTHVKHDIGEAWLGWFGGYGGRRLP